jgi:hypothetical protein
MLEHQLQVAISQGKTKWLQELLAKKLPEFYSEDVDYGTWFDSVIEHMEKRGLNEPKKQKNFLTDIRNAIKILDPNHAALEIVKFDKQTWTEINNAQSARLAERTTKFISDPDAIVKRATTLLNSYQWSEVAAALSILTGRRCTEIIQTAKFEYKTKYSVTFSGSLKRRGEPIQCVFEIPTLAPAQLIIKAIANLRNQLSSEIVNLSPRQVSGRYSRAVASKCDLHFKDLVPRREEKDNLYTHLFRAVYATIAAHWFCPPAVPELEYRAAIQGHYQILDEKNPELRRSLAAGRNYFDYQISDRSSNIDGRLGIKLHLPDVKVIEQWNHISLEHEQKQIDPYQPLSTTALSNKPNPIMTEPSSSSNTASVTIPYFLLSRLQIISSRLGLSTADTIQALFNWTEVSLSLADSLDVDQLTPNALFAKVEELRQTPREQSTISLDNNQPDFDRESINNLCASVKLLAQTINQQNLPSPVTVIKKEERSSDRSYDQLVNGKKASYQSKELSNSQNRDKKSDPGDQQSNSEQSTKLSVSSRSEEIVNRAIDTMINFNNTEGLAQPQKWYIGIGALRKLSGRGDSVIKRVLTTRAAEIEKHNLEHGLGKWHNARGKEALSIDQVISFSA